MPARGVVEHGVAARGEPDVVPLDGLVVLGVLLVSERYSPLLLRKPWRKTISGSRSPFFTPAGSVSVVSSGVPSKLATVPVQIVCGVVRLARVAEAGLRRRGGAARDARRGARPGQRISRSSRLRSSAGAECVSAPTEMKSTPVSATSRTFSSVMPPEASSVARPPARATHSRSSAGVMLSSSSRRAPASSATSTSSSVSHSTSPRRPRAPRRRPCASPRPARPRRRRGSP